MRVSFDILIQSSYLKLIALGNENMLHLQSTKTIVSASNRVLISNSVPGSRQWT